MAGLELHKHIDIAIRPEVISQCRPEEGQAADMMPAAKICYFIPINRYAIRVCLRQDIMHAQEL